MSNLLTTKNACKNSSNMMICIYTWILLINVLKSMLLYAKFNDVKSTKLIDNHWACIINCII